MLNQPKMPHVKNTIHKHPGVVAKLAKAAPKRKRGRPYKNIIVHGPQPRHTLPIGTRVQVGRFEGHIRKLRLWIESFHPETGLPTRLALHNPLYAVEINPKKRLPKHGTKPVDVPLEPGQTCFWLFADEFDALPPW